MTPISGGPDTEKIIQADIQNLDHRAGDLHVGALDRGRLHQPFERRALNRRAIRPRDLPRESGHRHIPVPEQRAQQRIDHHTHRSSSPASPVQTLTVSHHVTSCNQCTTVWSRVYASAR